VLAVATTESSVSTVEVRVGVWFAAVQPVIMMNTNTDNGNIRLAFFIQISLSWGGASEASCHSDFYTTRQIVEFKI
jgi:hypothetical protein